jgi:hypothetical protein
MNNAATNSLPDPLQQEALVQKQVIAEIEYVIDTGKRREFTVKVLEQFVDRVADVLTWVRRHENDASSYIKYSDKVSDLLREARNALDLARNELSTKGFNKNYTNNLEEGRRKLKGVLDAWVIK